MDKLQTQIKALEQDLRDSEDRIKQLEEALERKNKKEENILKLVNEILEYLVPSIIPAKKW